MWTFFSDLTNGALRWMGSLMDNIAQAIINGVQGFGNWLSRSLGDSFEAITSFLSAILQPFLDLIGGLLYLLSNLVDVLILVIQVLLLVVQVLLSLAGGLFRSFAMWAVFDPATVPADHNPFASGTSLIFDVFSQAGGDVVAAVLSWACWFILAFAVMRLFARDRATS